MATLVYDSFGRVGALAGSTTELGGKTWVAYTPTSFTNNWETDGSDAISRPNNPSDFVIAINSGISDGFVIGQVTRGGTLFTGLAFRVVDLNNLWIAAFNGSSFGLFRRVNGTWTQVQSISTLTIAGVKQEIAVELNGDSIKARLDGSHELSTTSSIHMGATRHGVYSNQNDDRCGEFSVESIPVTFSAGLGITANIPGNEKRLAIAARIPLESKLQVEASIPARLPLQVTANIPLEQTLQVQAGVPTGYLTIIAGTQFPQNLILPITASIPSVPRATLEVLATTGQFPQETLLVTANVEARDSSPLGALDTLSTRVTLDAPLVPKQYIFQASVSSAIGGGVSGSLLTRYPVLSGLIRMALLENGATRDTLSTRLHTIDAAVMNLPELRLADGGGREDTWRRTYPDSLTQLEVILPELMPESEIEALELYDYEASLGLGMVQEAECRARALVASKLPTRLQLARAAASEAGMMLAIREGAGLALLNERVSMDYRTQGKAAREVIDELILGVTQPRYWADHRTLTIDGRSISSSSPSAGWPIAVTDSWVTGATVSYEAAQEIAEPRLENFLAECGQSELGTTWELTRDGEKTFVEHLGSRVNNTYSRIERRVRKNDWRIMEVNETTHANLLRPRRAPSFGVASRRILKNEFHPICTRVVVASHEIERVTKSYDLFTSLIGNREFESETLEAIFNATPETWLQSEKRTEVSYHAEGWEKTRTESTREMSGLVVRQYQQDGSTRYMVRFVYSVTTKSISYFPDAPGLWRVVQEQTNEVLRPVFLETGNSNEVELDTIAPARETLRNVRNTDESPPMISCETSCDKRSCEEKALEKYEKAMQVYEAQKLNGRARLVYTYSFAVPQLNIRTGDLIGGCIVAADSHDFQANAGVGSQISLWRYLEGDFGTAV